MANAVEKLNTIAIGDIEKFNTFADSDIEKINTLEFTDAATPAALQCDGTGDYLSVVHDDAFDFAGGDFTLEGWFLTSRSHTSSTTSGWRGLFGIVGPDGNIWLRHNSEAIEWNWGSGIDFTSSNSQTVGSWFHAAFVMSGGTATIYIDGTSGGTDSRTGDFAGASQLNIGISYSGNADWEGYIDEVRVSGVARYSGNFTPSTSEFTSDSDTILLLHMNGDNDGTAFTDSSSNGYTVTVNGNAHTDTSYGIGTSNDVG